MGRAAFQCLARRWRLCVSKLDSNQPRYETHSKATHLSLLAAFVAYARQQGVYAFWAGTPNTALGAVTTHWITEGATELIYGADENRCILVSSGMGVTERMYAHLRPCDAKLADGILTVAAAAAPPPPPGSNQFNYSFFDPHIAPPPPPSILSASWERYTKSDILPRTEAICSIGAVEGRGLVRLCTEMAEHLARWQPVAGVGLRAPLCRSDICFRSCDANHVSGDDDSFTNCQSLSCAKNDCMEFLKAACPPTLHNSFQVLYDAACTIVPPSPPRPPGSPPSPPRPPGLPPPSPPPPRIKGTIRRRDEETAWQDDCQLSHYSDCLEATKQYAARNPGYTAAVRITSAPCEGLDGEEACFLGCSFGSPQGGVYRWLLGEVYDQFKNYNTYRCRLAEFPFCLCAQPAPPPPFVLPPPPPVQLAEEWTVATDGNQRDATKGRVSALFKRLVNGRMMDPALRSSSHLVSCPLDDDCSHKCAIECSNEHLSTLRAFGVTGESWIAHTPQAPPPPPPADTPPSPPFAPFSECTNLCVIEEKFKTKCRDGGYGSFFPSHCHYSSQCGVCGPRENIGALDNSRQDDSCPTARNGICEDGGTGSSFFVDVYEEETHLCPFGTDYADCVNHGPRLILSRGGDTFSGVTNVTKPYPPPPGISPSPPPPPPPIIPDFEPCVRDAERVCYAFFERGTNNLLCSGNKQQLEQKWLAGVVGCKDLDSFLGDPNAENVCSDGGYDARTVERQNRTYDYNAFACSYGHQCLACGRARPRQFTVGCVDSCGLDADPRLYPTASSTVNGTGDAFVNWALNGEAGVLDPTTRNNRIYCRDGGVDAVSGHCNYGTQVFWNLSVPTRDC
jgi:hypothetical protein